MDNAIARNIMMACARVHCSIAELAESSGVPESRIQALTQGGNISMADLHAIAKVLYVDVNELLDPDGPQAIAPALWC